MLKDVLLLPSVSRDVAAALPDSRWHFFSSLSYPSQLKPAKSVIDVVLNTVQFVEHSLLHLSSMIRSRSPRSTFLLMNSSGVVQEQSFLEILDVLPTDCMFLTGLAVQACCVWIVCHSLSVTHSNFIAFSETYSAMGDCWVTLLSTLHSDCQWLRKRLRVSTSLLFT